MSEVQFNEEPQFQRKQVESRTGNLTKFVIQNNLAKDEGGAQRVLLVVLAACVLSILAVLWLSGRESLEQTITNQELEQIRLRMSFP
ncbi:MAG TPA: hypothetical protein PK609_03335 [Candidatus Paceibacterota bacterium]|nr:hypothetical protein [Candidatus Paceibacterota bacterium]